MYFSGKWSRRLCAAVIGAAVVGTPLFAVHAGEEDGGMSRHGQHRYDVRRGMYEKEGGSDTEVSRGMYEQPSEDGHRRGLQR